MKSAEQIVAYIARRIGYVYYHRPLMYGGSGTGVDQLLHTYHDIWAEIVDRGDEFRRVYWQALYEAECGSANFATRFSLDLPGTPENVIADYVVMQWRKISERLELPIPHEELEKEFSDPSSP